MAYQTTFKKMTTYLFLKFLVPVSLLFVSLYFLGKRFRKDIKHIFKYDACNPHQNDDVENSESAANRIQFFCQRLIFATLTAFLLFKGAVELIDTFSPSSLSSNHLITHIKQIKTLSYVAKALAVSCGFQLAFMLITKGPDEAIEPIMLGIASIILLMLSVIEPQDWSVNNSLSIAILILCIGALYFLSRKVSGKD